MRSCAVSLDPILRAPVKTRRNQMSASWEAWPLGTKGKAIRDREAPGLRTSRAAGYTKEKCSFPFVAGLCFPRFRPEWYPPEMLARGLRLIISRNPAVRLRACRENVPFRPSNLGRCEAITREEAVLGAPRAAARDSVTTLCCREEGLSRNGHFPRCQLGPHVRRGRTPVERRDERPDMQLIAGHGGNWRAEQSGIKLTQVDSPERPEADAGPRASAGPV